MNKKKYLTMLALTVITLSLCGCGTQENSPADNSKVAEQSVNDTTTDTLEALDDSNQVANNTPETEGTVESESTEEIVNESVSKEPEAEMVDFETWVKQEGNDEVCLVVWNEELGVQEIVPTWVETNEIYEIRDGDKFAVPFNEIVTAIHINDESHSYPATADSLEVSLTKGQLNEIIIFFTNAEGETKTKGYLLK